MAAVKHDAERQIDILFRQKKSPKQIAEELDTTMEFVLSTLYMYGHLKEDLT